VVLLNDNIALNKFTNIQVFEHALGAAEGKGEIYPETIKHNRGAASMLKREGQGTLKYDIIIKKLDDVIGDAKPKMIKIDVEGWE
ncbi:FkbM family methyltransferase, partial [Streptomyces turgidiscabies]|uniref:FkbM family methyltransferase n=1 Tax=Streptomyces turgidiscabies TaxID=85558 RepID=UPI0038F72A3F